VEHAREHGRVTIKEMTLLTGTSRNTLKEHFQRLLETGMLERNGQGRGVWYRVK
jgi:predicted transcriptional regulator of viral defense system